MSTTDHRFLALLPPPPSPPTHQALKAAYHASLFTILRSIVSTPNHTSKQIGLDIVLPCPHLYDQHATPRSLLYENSQALLAGLYKLICVIAATQSINIEDTHGIDVHVHLVAYPRSGKWTANNEGTPERDAEGPVVDFATFVTSGRQWTGVFAVETESGDQVLKNYLAHNRNARVEKVRGGIVAISTQDDSLGRRRDASFQKRHAAVAVGGTFDHLHIGHKLLLSMTAFMLDSTVLDSIERSLTIGITGDELLKNKKYAEHLESWSARQESVHKYLNSILNFSPLGQNVSQRQEKFDPGPNGHAVLITLPSKLVLKYVEIWDPFGPTITDKDITALVLSAETRSGGAAVNKKRQENGWPPLEVFEVDVLHAEDEDAQSGSSEMQDSFQSKLSSTEIRRKLVQGSTARNNL